ncbi:hypothetical protein EIP91_001109 [Steccherinum ochraceum]|uniref:HPt domain-containing protein n=1 Tax=Steccherinum ochraceum TaxID=92696 RepID=A0A4R0REQ7_9APHY|nr:hypothetical protein EIP91_001109 [Steccherinum ochraceum]
MSFSRATSQAPRSPAHVATKEPISFRHTSPIPNGRGDRDREPSPKSIASALLSPVPASKAVLPPEKELFREREGSVKPVAAAEKKSQEPPAAAPEPLPEEDVIDMETFEQILELDDGETREFSHEMVKEYFKQAEKTFDDMQEAFNKDDLDELSKRGHFLKGSSAALGISKVQASCEMIQNLGKLQEGDKTIPQPEALAQLEVLLPQVKVEYAVAKRWLQNFYAAEEAAAED